MPGTIIQLTLEGIDQASTQVKAVNAAVAELGKTAATATSEASPLGNALGAVALGAKNTATATGSLSGQNAELRNGFVALKNTVTIVALTTMPALSSGIMIADAAFRTIKASAAAAGTSMAVMAPEIAVIALGLVAIGKAVKEGVGMWRDTQTDIDSAARATEGFEGEQKKARQVLVDLAAAGKLSGDELQRMMQVINDAHGTDGLSKISRQLIDIQSQAISVQDKLQFDANRFGGEAQGIISDLALEQVPDPDKAQRAIKNLQDQAKAYQLLNVEIARQQVELQKKLGLNDQDIQQNKEWLDLQAQGKKALDAAAEAQREITEVTDDQKKKRDKIRQSEEQSTISLLGSAADAAKLFGREGFVAWKTFALAQAIVSGALAVVNALAMGEELTPFGAAIAAAAAGAAAAVQVATIAATQPSGYAAGGFTGPGGRDEPAGLVHRGEVVFGQKAVRRLGLPFLMGLGPSDYSRPNVSAIPAFTGPFPGYAQGGLVTGASGKSVNIAFLDNRQNRRDWMRRDGIKVVLSELARRGNKVSI